MIVVRPLYLIILFPLYAQAQEKTRPELEYIQRAAAALCSDDTLQTIQLIEGYIADHGGSNSDLGPYKTLGDIYYDLGDTGNAVRTWELGLRAGRSSYFDSFIRKCGKWCHRNWCLYKADIYVQLSGHYSETGSYEKALKYLDLADTEHLPSFGGCANGMIMYRTMLSLHFAETYLQMGDTTKAIQRLLEYFMSMESYSDDVTAMLHQILLTDHSQKEITDQVKKAIKGMRIVRGGPNEPEEILEFSVFDHTIRKRAYRSLRDQKRLFREHRNIKTLMGV